MTITEPADDQQEQLPIEAPTKPHQSKAVVVLASVVAVLVLAAGALGTLWLVEKGDHKATGGHLDAVRSELGAAKSDLGKSQANLKDAETLAQYMSNEKARLERANQKLNFCAKSFQTILDAKVEADFEKAFDETINACSGLPGTN